MWQLQISQLEHGYTFLNQNGTVDQPIKIWLQIDHCYGCEHNISFQIWHKCSLGPTGFILVAKDQVTKQ